MKIEKGKAVKIIKCCIYIIIVMCVLYNIMFSINTAISQNNYFKLFGISFFNMKTNLMKDDINSGDFIIAKSAKIEDLREGDIIAYTVNGKTRINKIFKIQQDEYTTKSNKNYYPDIEKINYNQIIGKMVANVHFIGFIVVILQSKITTGFILLLLILYFLYDKYLDKKKKERIKKKHRKNTV